MEILLKIHGEVRWLVALVALIAILRFALGWLRRSEFRALDRGLMAAFSGLLDLNLVLGTILLFGLGGGLMRHRLEHMATMLLALIVAHLSAIWRRSEDSGAKFRNSLIAILVASALVVVGVVRLRGGWVF